MKTKIICSIGPASSSQKIIKALIENGMDVARFNFSHENRAIHSQRINLVRKLSRCLGKYVEILCDLQGPKIRLCNSSNLPKDIEEDKIIILSNNKKNASKNVFCFDDPYLHADLKINDIILIDDGQIELSVVKIEGKNIFCKVICGGTLYPRKGINVPYTITTTSSLTKKDLKDLKFILSKKPEWVGLSFVQNSQDVEILKKLIGRSNTRVMCKIEKASAINNLQEIIEEADGIMVARGDLGVEIPIEKLPIVQKRIINECNETGTPVVTATQMLASMTKSKISTRAEASDVANAVIDGTDFVMLSNETTVGQYPVEALKTMVKIVQETEKYLARK